MEIHLSGKVFFYARDLARGIGSWHGWKAHLTGTIPDTKLDLARKMGKKTRNVAVLPAEIFILAEQLTT